MNYELAKELKDLRYIQPKFEIGQKWINEKDIFLVLYILDDDVTFWRKDIGVTNLYSLTKLNEHIDLCYIPTFEKLWKVLPEYISSRGDYNQYDNNILESAAKMWILLKEKNLLKNLLKN